MREGKIALSRVPKEHGVLLGAEQLLVGDLPKEARSPSTKASQAGWRGGREEGSVPFLLEDNVTTVPDEGLWWEKRT